MINNSCLSSSFKMNCLILTSEKILLGIVFDDDILASDRKVSVSAETETEYSAEF